MIEKAKRIAAGLLLLASLLPIAQCKSKEPVQPQNTETRAALQQERNPQHPPMSRPIHVWQDLSPSDPHDWVFALAFVWPVPLILVRQKFNSSRVTRTTKILEVPLCALTSYIMYCYISEPSWQLLLGGYVAVVGITIYEVAILADVFNWKRKEEAG
jgi:hypothetical protein